MDRERRLSYGCDVDRSRLSTSRVTYSYDDGRTGWDFPVPAVRACQDAVRTQMARERGRREPSFESAGISPGLAGVERVQGRGRERGAGGPAFEYRCDVQRGRVVSADFQPIR